ncbi:hypothetical protein KP509_21G078800 [Ceratopteris richardii]|nr:hypothetical protein KP509_21G078800 [Ceratopteris richardii]
MMYFTSATSRKSCYAWVSVFLNFILSHKTSRNSERYVHGEVMKHFPSPWLPLASSLLQC